MQEHLHATSAVFKAAIYSLEHPRHLAAVSLVDNAKPNRHCCRFVGTFILLLVTIAYTFRTERYGRYESIQSFERFDPFVTGIIPPPP